MMNEENNQNQNQNPYNGQGMENNMQGGYQQMPENGMNQQSDPYQWSTQNMYGYNGNPQGNPSQNQNYGANWNQQNTYYAGPVPQTKKEKKPKNPNSFGNKLVRCTAYALAFGLVGGALFQGSSYVTGNLLGNHTQQQAEATQTDGKNKIAATTTAASSNIKTTTDVSELVPKVMPSIVAITNVSQERVRDFFGQTQIQEGESAGSGIIIKEDDKYLYIATNNHVVSNAETLTVQFQDNSTATAEIQGTDTDNDLAVIKIQLSELKDDTKKNIKVAALGDSDQVEVGESAIAIGNALGYGQSVTTGIISAKERSVTFQDETSGQSTTNYLIQTDAAINPGNSGGALVNLEGEIIGINSSKYSDTSVEGMGFAIPSNRVKESVDQLIEKGYMTKAYLGITGVDVTESVANTYNMPSGVYINEVFDDTGASKAGLQQGQIITAIDKKEITSMQELKAEIIKHKVGDTITLTVQTTKNSEYVESKVKVELGEYNEKEIEEQQSESNSQNQQKQKNQQGQNPYEDGGEEDPFEEYMNPFN
ncbi:MAG: S1C family serine protease [Lachnospiraceae bacterium]